MQMEGLSFLAMDEGRTVIEIKADRFVVKNMKVGYFSFSMAPVAFLENARIDAYSAGGTQNMAELKAASSDARSIPNSLDFNHALSKEAFASFPAKNIANIEAAPITFALHADDRVVTQISAKKAELRFRDKDVLFSGDVKAVSGLRQLTSKTLRLSPSDGRMEAYDYTIIYQEKSESGRQLKTDLVLKRFL